MTATEFRLPIGTPLPATLLAGRRDIAGFSLTIEVDAPTWHQIDMMMLFNLLWDKRNEGSINEGGSVQIELLLNPELDDEFAAAVGDDIVAGFAALPDDSPMRSTAQWYGLEVTEAVPLPPSLAGKGELRSGFTTVWSDR